MILSYHLFIHSIFYSAQHLAVVVLCLRFTHSFRSLFLLAAARLVWLGWEGIDQLIYQGTLNCYFIFSSHMRCHWINQTTHILRYTGFHDAARQVATVGIPEPLASSTSDFVWLVPHYSSLEFSISTVQTTPDRLAVYTLNDYQTPFLAVLGSP